MPTLVHLADERDYPAIKKNGLKIGKYRSGVYCMPVMQDFYISHQWLRELKRFGGNTFVGVYFRVDSSEKVFAGKYNEPHKHIMLGEAIKKIHSLEDPLGYELIIDRKIKAKEIQKIRHLPQTAGWRYIPGSNGQRPCGCDYCQRGLIKGKSVREKYAIDPPQKVLPYTEILSRLKKETEENEIKNLLWAIKRKRRSSDPAELLFLLHLKSDSINRELALTLAKFRHKNTGLTLQQLLHTTDKGTKEYAVDSLLKLYGPGAKEMLMDNKDTVIKNAVAQWLTDK